MPRPAPLLVLGLVLGCGARSETKNISSRAPLEIIDLQVAGQPICSGALDCDSGDRCLPSECIDGLCVTQATICDDGDDCTSDSCDSDTGDCVFEPLTRDLDGDGVNGPRAGFAPGAPGACGDDCDDSQPLALPGGVELCDGVDNDCNGVVDDGTRLIPSGREPLLLSSGNQQAAPGGVAHSGDYFGVVYTARDGSWVNHFVGLDDAQRIVVPRRRITNVNSDTFTGPVVWNGQDFATVWEDRRDDDFEVYFAALSPEGEKLRRELRVTNAPDFSIGVDLVWLGHQYVAAWGDRRERDFGVYAQVIGPGGAPLGGNVSLTPEYMDAVAPDMARADVGFGMVFNARGENNSREVRFMTVSADLTEKSEIVTLSSPDGAGASVVFNRDRYVVVWHQDDGAAGDSIWGAAVARDGSILIGETRLTEPAMFAGSQAILALGDRLLLVWSSFASGSYDLYSKELTPDLRELSPREVVTSVPDDAVEPTAALGPGGTAGILYQQFQRAGAESYVYFTTLDCRAR